MQKLIVALAMVAGTAMTANNASASLPTATPLYACSLKATAIHDNRFYVILKAGEVNATGTMTCVAWNGQTTHQRVNVTIRELGIGAGFGFPASQSRIAVLSLKGGVSTPEGMYGKYSLQAGVGATLGAERIAVEGGIEATPVSEIGGKVQIKLEQLAGLGLDVTTSEMTITRAQR